MWYTISIFSLILLENPIFIVMGLLPDNHVLAQCDVFISISRGNVEFFVHPPQSASDKILASVNSITILQQLDQHVIQFILITLK